MRRSSQRSDILFQNGDIYAESTCCCCLSPKTGTTILGIFVILQLLQWLNPDQYNLIGILINFALASCFIYMFTYDSEMSRRLVFIGYLICSIGTVTYGIHKSFMTIKEEKPWIQSCEKMKNSHGSLKQEGFASEEDCEERIRKIVFIGLICAYILTVFLAIHFNRVIYVHWKKWGQTKENGGTVNQRTNID